MDPPAFVVEFPIKPTTYAYTTTPAAIAMSIMSSVAMIGLMPFLGAMRFIRLHFYAIVFVLEVEDPPSGNTTFSVTVSPLANPVEVPSVHVWVAPGEGVVLEQV